MEKIFLFLILFCSNSFFAQSIEQLKKSDTLYVFFDHGIKQQRLSQTNINGTKTGDFYYFYFNHNKDSYLIFSHVYSLKPEVRTQKKSFLRKNKKNIIGVAFFEKYTLSEIIKIFSGGKKIYIIDKEDFKEGKITLKEVRVQSSILNEM